MITRHFQKGDAASYALYSPCETYRYRLMRLWDRGLQRVAFVLLNPSTATERHNDPTVERCERRARALGFGAFVVVNLFALRATNPQRLRAHANPVGAKNDSHIAAACHWADICVAGWGNHGTHRQRGPAIAHMLARLDVPTYHLGLNQSGHPVHPLYVPYARQPSPWSHDARATLGRQNTPC